MKTTEKKEKEILRVEIWRTINVVQKKRMKVIEEIYSNEITSENGRIKSVKG